MTASRSRPASASRTMASCPGRNELKPKRLLSAAPRSAAAGDAAVRGMEAVTPASSHPGARLGTSLSCAWVWHGYRPVVLANVLARVSGHGYWQGGLDDRLAANATNE